MGITWFTWPCDDVTVNDVEAGVDRSPLEAKQPGSGCLCVNKFRTQKDISSGYATFRYPGGKVGSYFVCKVSVVIRSWLIIPRHAKFRELEGKWPVFWLGGDMAALNLDRGYVFWIQANCTLPGLLHVFHYEFKKIMNSKWRFCRKKIGKWKLSFLQSISIHKYANYIGSKRHMIFI